MFCKNVELHDILVPFVAKYEQGIKQKKVSTSRSYSKEVETPIVVAYVKEVEVEPTKEEGELNVENLAKICAKEDLFVPCANLVVEEHNEKKRENMSE